MRPELPRGARIVHAPEKAETGRGLGRVLADKLRQGAPPFTQIRRYDDVGSWDTGSNSASDRSCMHAITMALSKEVAYEYRHGELLQLCSRQR